MVDYAYGFTRTHIAGYLRAGNYKAANDYLGEIMPFQGDQSHITLSPSQLLEHQGEQTWVRYMLADVALRRAGASAAFRERKLHHALALHIGSVLIDLNKPRPGNRIDHNTAYREQALGHLVIARAMSMPGIDNPGSERSAENIAFAHHSYNLAYEMAQRLPDLEGEMLAVEVAAAAVSAGVDNDVWDERLRESLTVADVNHRALDEFDREGVMSPREVAAQYLPAFAVQRATIPH